MKKIEKIILKSGVAAGLGAAFLGAKLDATFLMGIGAGMAGATVLYFGVRDFCRTIKEENKNAKSRADYKKGGYKNEQTGKSGYCWNYRDWR